MSSLHLIMSLCPHRPQAAIFHAQPPAGSTPAAGDRGGTDMTHDTDTRELSEFVAAENSGEENNADTEVDDLGLADLEDRIDELEAGMKAVASSIEDTIDQLDRLADHVDTDDESNTEPDTRGLH
jgi:hypothetical protein